MPQGTDSQPHWYVADVNPKFEKKMVDVLSKDGIECFIPVRKTVDISGKRPKAISTPLSPGLIYHCVAFPKSVNFPFFFTVLKFRFNSLAIQRID